MPGSHGELSVSADDIARRCWLTYPPCFRNVDALRRRRVAAGFVLNYSMTLILKDGFISDFVLKRRLLNATRVAPVVVARSGVYLGPPIGPEAADVFWDSAVAKLSHRCTLI